MGQLPNRLVVEAGLGLSVIAILAVLGTMIPAAHQPIVWPFSWRLGLDALLSDPDIRADAVFSGNVGCLLALIGTVIVNQFLGGGLQLTITPGLIALGIGLSVLMGTLGGLIPAWRAAQLVPMDAIRLGAH